MKASLAWMLILTAPLAGCSSCHGGNQTPPPPPKVDTVVLTRAQTEDTTHRLAPPPHGQANVVVFCPGDSGKVVPWSLNVLQHDSVRWQLTGTDSMRVSPDTSPAWPFMNAEPTGTSETPAASGAMKEPPPPHGTVFHYRIVTHCGRTVVIIDPELIIT